MFLECFGVVSELWSMFIWMKYVVWGSFHRPDLLSRWMLFHWEMTSLIRLSQQEKFHHFWQYKYPLPTFSSTSHYATAHFWWFLQKTKNSTFYQTCISDNPHTLIEPLIFQSQWLRAPKQLRDLEAIWYLSTTEWQWPESRHSPDV